MEKCMCNECRLRDEVSRLEAENKELEYHFELMADTIEDYQAELRAKDTGPYDVQYRKLDEMHGLVVKLCGDRLWEYWAASRELSEKEPWQAKAEVRGETYLPPVGSISAPETPAPSEEGKK